MRLPYVAPRELVQADYDILNSYERLDTTEEVQDLLFIQSLEGRAHNGAGAFNKRTYVNTTIDDVVRALGRNPDEIKARRQDLIDDIVQFALDTMDGTKHEKLINSRGEPMLGIEIFRDRHVNARDVVRGLYIGGLRDNPDIRKEAERIYKTKIGGGRCYIIDIKTMLDMKLDGEVLAHEPHEDKIDEYIRRGLIVKTEGEVDPETQRYFYIRHRVGPGQSDDGAFIMAGILYNPDVALGVFLADIIDTLEKYAPVYKDQDGNLSFLIARGFKDLKMTLEDVYEFVSISAIPEAEELTVPDSSLRYLLSIDSRVSRSAFKSHLDFIEGKPVVPLLVSFKRILSTHFYEYINRRLINMKKFEKLAVPGITVQEIEKPIADILKKDFAVVMKDATIADVVRKFKETKCEVVVVQDKNMRIVGTITASDLYHYL